MPTTERATWDRFGHVFRSLTSRRPLPRVVSNVDCRRCLFRRLACASIPGCSRSRPVGGRYGFAESALAALAEPNRWPGCTRGRVRAMDIAESASFATQGNPDHFERMPTWRTRASGSRSAAYPFRVNDWRIYICGMGASMQFRHQRPAAGVIRRATSGTQRVVRVVRQAGWCHRPAQLLRFGCRAGRAGPGLGQDERLGGERPNQPWRDRVSDSLLVRVKGGRMTPAIRYDD